MAKHPHRLVLQEKRTWRCTLPGCSFFVHLGLAHVLIGKTAICWECGDHYTVDEAALRDDMPMCMDCRLGNKAELQKALSIVEKHGLKTIPKEEEGMTPLERLYLRARKNAEVVSIPDEENEIEVIPAEEEHAADCGIWADNECDCK